MAPAGLGSQGNYGHRVGSPIYVGSLSDDHVRAVARLALTTLGVRPDFNDLDVRIRDEQALARRLVKTFVPGRLPDLAAALISHRVNGRPALVERIPGMLALGWRHIQVLRWPEQPGPESVDLGLLGATFNAAISIYDHLLDEPDRTRPMPVGAVAEVGALVKQVITELSPAEHAASYSGQGPPAAKTPHTAFVDPDWVLLVVLIRAWSALAKSVAHRNSNTEAWQHLGEVIAGLLAAETRLSAGEVVGKEAQDLEQWVSRGPSTALGLMASLDGAAPGTAEAADHLGGVLWLVDDLVDLASDARRRQPNAHLEGTQMRTLHDRDLYRHLQDGARRLAGHLGSKTSERVAHYASELAFRWLQWDQHRPAATCAQSLKGATYDAASAGAAFLLLRAAADYADDAHRLTFPRQGSEGVRLETHQGVVFLRATVVDALLDCRDAGIEMSEGVLAAEGMELLLAKHPLVRGGWSYLPSVPELPPDADDLSQVLRALRRLGGRTLAGTCDQAIRLALDIGGVSGQVPTWLIPTSALTAADLHMRDCVELLGGGGSHTDVVANFLTALAMHDPVRYAEPCARGTARIAADQRPDGTWSSVWYTGPYYVSALAVTALRIAGGYEDHVASARAFLLAGQRPDGGWRESDAEVLPTAQSLLALCAVGHVEDQPIRRAAIRRLMELQERDGGWAAEPWIEFPTTDGRRVYGSRASSTAYAVKALLGTMRVDGAEQC